MGQPPLRSLPSPPRALRRRHPPRPPQKERPALCVKPSGEGLPEHGVPSEYGALHVLLAIDMPKALSGEERAFVASHFEPSATLGSKGAPKR